MEISVTKKPLTEAELLENSTKYLAWTLEYKRVVNELHKKCPAVYPETLKLFSKAEFLNEKYGKLVKTEAQVEADLKTAVKDALDAKGIEIKI